MSRRLRSKIPSTISQLKPQIQKHKEEEEQIAMVQQTQKIFHDKHAGKPHKQLKVGDHVRFMTHQGIW